MRTVLFLKRTDVILQVLAIFTPLVCAVIMDSFEAVFVAYFSAGIVQLVSIFLNKIFLDKFLRKPGRRACEITTVTLIALLFVSWIGGYWIAIYLYGLLVIAPVLSITYLVVSWKETVLIKSMVMRRELW